MPAAADRRDSSRPMIRAEARGGFSGAHRDGVWALSAVPGASTLDLASGGMDGALRFWGPASDDGDDTRRQTSTVAQDLAQGDDAAKVGAIDPPSGIVQKAQLPEAHALSVVNLSRSLDNQLLASSGLDGFLNIWKVETLQRVQRLDAHAVDAWSTAFHPGGRILAASSQYGRVSLFNVETGQKDRSIAAGDSTRMIMSVAFDSTGRSVACGSSEGAICVFDVETGQLRRRIDAHSMPIRSISFDPSDDQSIWSSSDDHLIRSFDPESGEGTGTLVGHTGIVPCFDVAPNNFILASGSGDESVRLWDKRNFATIHTFSGHHCDVIWSVRFCQGSALLASASDDGSIRFWASAEGSS